MTNISSWPALEHKNPYFGCMRPYDIFRRIYLHLYCKTLAGFFAVILTATGAWAQQDFPSHTVEEMVVTGSSMPRTLELAGQSMSVISREDIEVLPVSTIAGILDTVNGVDVRQRGASGIQSDISIRGSSFEQTLILVDGINMSDGQTGHHNMNLPVNLSDIERIEILKGPGARIYGHNAMAGVINIITRDPEFSQIGGELQFGEDDFYGVGASFSGRIKALSNRLSISKKASSGYIPTEETDFDIRTLSYKGTVKGNNNAIQVGIGYTENDFGAYKFYSDVFPNQRENTRTLLVYGSGDFKISGMNVSQKCFFRRNKDEFRIEIGGNWFENQHQTDSYGFQAVSRIETFLGQTAVGVEMTKEDLRSSNLGNHDRSRQGMFFEHKFFPVDRVIVGLGTSVMKYSDWGWEYWPGADINIRLSHGFYGYASIARSFRIPTYTELYYRTPANLGNPDLEPEEAWTGEAGIRRFKNGLGLQAGLFYRDVENAIDWTRKPGDTAWQVGNMTESRTKGLELSMDLYPGILFDTLHRAMFQLSYTHLDSSWDSGSLESKYILDHLRHQINGTILVDWLDTLNQAIEFRYEKRMNGNSHVVVGSRLTCKRDPFEFYLDVTNLTDESFIDNGFAPAPGRWIFIGARFNKDLL